MRRENVVCILLSRQLIESFANHLRQAFYAAPIILVHPAQ